MVERFLKVTLVEKKLAGRVKVGDTAKEWWGLCSLIPRLRREPGNETRAYVGLQCEA